MRRWLTIGLLVVAFAGVLRGQRPEASPASDTKAPAFDVTSVKPNTSHNSGIGGPGDRRGSGEFRATNIPLRNCRGWNDRPIRVFRGFRFRNSSGLTAIPGHERPDRVKRGTVYEIGFGRINPSTRPRASGTRLKLLRQ